MSFLISPAPGDRRKFVPSRSARKCKAATCTFTLAHGLMDSWRSAVTGRWEYARIVSTLVLKPTLVDQRHTRGVFTRSLEGCVRLKQPGDVAQGRWHVRCGAALRQ